MARFIMKGGIVWMLLAVVLILIIIILAVKLLIALAPIIAVVIIIWLVFRYFRKGSVRRKDKVIEAEFRVKR